MADDLADRLGRDFQPGDVLFREGELGEVMFVVQTGRVRLTKLIDAQHTVLADLGPGDFIGAMALVSGRPRVSTVTALEPTRCLVIDSSTLEALVAGNAEIAIRLVKEFGRRLHHALDLLNVVGHRDATARMVAALGRYADRLGAPVDEEGVVVRVALADIARSAAVGPHELENIAAALERLKLAEFTDDGILVPNVARLYEFIEFADV